MAILQKEKEERRKAALEARKQIEDSMARNAKQIEEEKKLNEARKAAKELA